jgi:hypothetical protein
MTKLRKDVPNFLEWKQKRTIEMLYKIIYEKNMNRTLMPNEKTDTLNTPVNIR